MYRSLIVAAVAMLSMPAFAQQPSIYGSWCAVLGDGWVSDTPNRALVVEQDNTCKWDLPKPNPGKAKACSVKSGEVNLTTGADSKLGLKLRDAEALEGWFQLKGAASKVYRVTATRGPCKS